jgi:hypothetical protein
MPIPVTDMISTTNPIDTYATHKSIYGHGGHHEVSTINERNLITTERKNIGMKVYVSEDGKTYELNGSLTWVEFAQKQSYHHDQQVALDSWVINHNLGFFPNIIIIDSTGEQVMGNIIYNSINTVTLSFSSAISGIAQLS